MWNPASGETWSRYIYRELLTELFGDYFSKAYFKFGTGKKIIKDNIELWFQRISYVGEIGWEIYIPYEKSKKIYVHNMTFLSVALAVYPFPFANLHSLNSSWKG